MGRSARKLAGALLMLSGVTHVAQLAVYTAEGHVVGAAVGGVVYFLVGAFLFFGTSRLALWLGAVLPALGGIGGVYRFFSIQSSPFIVFHVLVDVVVVPVCIYLVLRRATPNLTRAAE